MFDMNQIGKNISNLRKSIGITQMDLADKLGISFQAISNWERGISMPDISKLGELSSLFHVSIDEILGNQKTSDIAKNLIEDQPVSDVTMEKIEEIAPILYTEQVETLVEHTAENEINADSIRSIAPFLSQNFIDNFAKGLLEKTHSFQSIMPIISFISQDILNEQIPKIFSKTDDLWAFHSILPFIDQSVIDNLAYSCFEKTDDLNALHPIVAFVSKDTLNHIVAESLEKHGLIGFNLIMPFIDSKIIEDYILKHQA